MYNAAEKSDLCDIEIFNFFGFCVKNNQIKYT